MRTTGGSLTPGPAELHEEASGGQVVQVKREETDIGSVSDVPGVEVKVEEVEGGNPLGYQ